MEKYIKFRDLPQEEKRKRWHYYNKRAAKRKQFEKDVAKFTTTLQTSRSSTLNRNHLALINMELRKMVKLPYNWTDEDLQRAREMLNKLSKKYLQKPFYVLPEDQTSVMREVKNLLDSTKLDTKTRVNILYELLKSEVAELYLHPDGEPEPTAENALLYLTQDMGHAVPPWFNKALIALIRRNYKNEDYLKITKELRQAIQLDHMKETDGAVLQAALEKEK